MTRRSVLITAIAVLLAAGILFFIASQQRKADYDRLAQSSATSSAEFGSSRELSELTGELDLEALEDSAFVSILAPAPDGRPTSYMVTAERVEGQALIDAVRDSKRLKADDPLASGATTTTASAEPSDALSSTVTFVLVSRQTITFVMDLETGLLYRDGRAFRPDGDLAGLVKSAAAVGG